MDRIERYRRRRIKRRIQLGIRIGILLLVITLLGIVGKYAFMHWFGDDVYAEQKIEEMKIPSPEFDVQLLTVNPYSRPGTQSTRINNIVIHYTANPGTTAKQNRDYFEGLKDSKITEASSHFIVGLSGEIVQCVPTWEVAYASNHRNFDTVSIETCHHNADGTYTDETYESLVHLTAWLCEKFRLTEEDVIRHYDITGKKCPKYFVENEEAWLLFKKDVKRMLEES